jgi:hypothetical protein
MSGASTKKFDVVLKSMYLEFAPTKEPLMLSLLPSYGNFWLAQYFVTRKV